jgi:hypothetical protein
LLLPSPCFLTGAGSKKVKLRRQLVAFSCLFSGDQNGGSTYKMVDFPKKWWVIFPQNGDIFPHNGDFPSVSRPFYAPSGSL